MIGLARLGSSGSGIQGFVSEGALDAQEEIDQRSQSKWRGFRDYGGLEDVRNVRILVPFRESLWKEIWGGDFGIGKEESWHTHGLADCLYNPLAS